MNTDLFLAWRNIFEIWVSDFRGKVPTEDISNTPDIVSEENIEEKVVRQSEYTILMNLIQAMKSPDREIFVLRYYYQQTIKEIATTLQLKTKNAESLQEQWRRLRKNRSRGNSHTGKSEYFRS